MSKLKFFLQKCDKKGSSTFSNIFMYLNDIEHEFSLKSDKKFRSL